MKKVALVFVLAVLLPSLVLAWLAVRSLRDQQFLLEHQQALIDQHATDALAQSICGYLAQQQKEFGAQVENLAAGEEPHLAAVQFDDQIRKSWPLAEVGFCVTLSGTILSPSSDARAPAGMFYQDNKDFLGNRQVAEIYWNQNFASANAGGTAWANGSAGLQSFDSISAGAGGRQQLRPQQELVAAASPPPASVEFGSATKAPPEETLELDRTRAATKGSLTGGPIASDASGQNVSCYQQVPRTISPQNAPSSVFKDSVGEAQKNLSKVVPADAEFAQLIGNQSDGMLARFLQNRLELLFWHRLSREPDLIFGAQLNLRRVVEGLRGLVQPDTALQNEICLVILDDHARPVAVSRPHFSADWKRPFVATEIGDALPHWEAAAYLVNPAALTQAARTAELTLALLVALLVLAIGIGSWLIVSSLNAELNLARQKTDFVSNVSHELKTPLTSIRMFSELLAENRVADAAKQRSYLLIIAAEAARLTRLINNVLDFARMERGEKKYKFQPCDLTALVHSTAETIRPHLEANGFKFDCDLPSSTASIRGDADALSQVIVNLLSNAEKYANGGREIRLQLAQRSSPLPHAEIKVLDRGVGVPPGSEEKIFEKFYRAHDSLNSGVQGSGLGLTIARQIARAHGGELVYEPRARGGSCLILRIPITSGAP